MRSSDDNNSYYEGWDSLVCRPMNTFRDLSKIGILLIGISLLIIAGLAVHIYLIFIQHLPSTSTSPFNAYCSHNAIIIHANVELTEVQVYDNRSRQICFFDKIPRNSEELCMVEAPGVYVVKVGDHKNVVECWPPSRKIWSD